MSVTGTLSLCRVAILFALETISKMYLLNLLIMRKYNLIKLSLTVMLVREHIIHLELVSRDFFHL